MPSRAKRISNNFNETIAWRFGAGILLLCNDIDMSIALVHVLTRIAADCPPFFLATADSVISNSLRKYTAFNP